jgi:hypothetical protein
MPSVTKNIPKTFSYATDFRIQPPNVFYTLLVVKIALHTFPLVAGY